ncbi:AraC family transcriptional regulator [Paenibacillus sp. UNC496MF]|uniref:helix-turn-helix domain-containing protein n=1 Tax=Paenibacillus sp. UNC496MF TaxID=1502753 RepID=UPI0008E1281D|nr:helix-turn-helix domain-containing protein [Paenibacillus sp. UNC496MF]SFI41450.1 AraC family transcriptional regulator [Paenibacillus sp. UNC496MF]
MADDQEMVEEQRRAMRRAMDDVAAHLRDEGLSLEAAARFAGYSPFHFHRLFHAWTGETFGRYVRVRRLAGAARELRRTDRDGTRIALEAGYGSQPSFIRSFARMFGTSPRQFRRRDCTVHQPRFAELAARTVAGVVCLTDTSQDRNIAQAWTAFGARWPRIPDKTNEHVCYGLELYEPAAVRREGGFAYLAGVEVAAAPAAGVDGIVFRAIPGGRYAIFTHIGSTELLGETFDFIYRG